MKHGLLLIAFVGLFLLPCSAQMFESGMLVTREGDSLLGYVARATETTFAYKKDKNAAQTFYKDKEVAAYAVNNEVFEQHVVEALRNDFPEVLEVFLLVVVDGPVRLLEYKGTGLFGNEHVNYYLQQEGQEVPYRVNSSKGYFKTTMKYYFADCPELVDRIKSKELGYDNLIEIVNTYNAWYIVKAAENAAQQNNESGE
jgi:hypothetical protein